MSRLLHMRFVCSPQRQSIPTKIRTTSSARELIVLSQRTRYFRYISKRGISSPARWIRYYSHRYIVIIAGHAAAKCRHASHPMEGTGDQRDFVPMHHRGFTPDQNCCPTRLETTQAGQNDLAWEQRYYRRSTFAGCGQEATSGMPRNWPPDATACSSQLAGRRFSEHHLPAHQAGKENRLLGATYPVHGAPRAPVTVLLRRLSDHVDYQLRRVLHPE